MRTICSTVWGWAKFKFGYTMIWMGVVNEFEFTMSCHHSSYSTFSVFTIRLGNPIPNENLEIDVNVDKGANDDGNKVPKDVKNVVKKADPDAANGVRSGQRGPPKDADAAKAMEKKVVADGDKPVGMMTYIRQCP